MNNKAILFVSLVALVITMGIVGIVSAYQNNNAKIPATDSLKVTTCSSDCSLGASCSCGGSSQCANFVDKNGDGKCDCTSCAKNGGSCSCGAKSTNATPAKSSCGCGGAK